MEFRYNPDGAEKRYRDNLAAKGPQLKIGNDLEYAQYLENQVLEHGYSPAAILGHIDVAGLKFNTRICVRTFYNYIDKGIFAGITEKNLVEKGRRKKKKGGERRKPARPPAGTSIEKRPEEVNDRENFGNWEMDIVKGKQGESKNVLLVLTERKTRNEIIRKMPDGTTASVVEELDKLERNLGEKFPKIFRTITVDNGVEFSDSKGMETSIFNDDEIRVPVYYCHPYSSYERPSNEVNNKFIRRHIPKGTNFDRSPPEEIEYIEQWMNNYPRRIFGYHSSAWMFQKELEAIGIDPNISIA